MTETQTSHPTIEPKEALSYVQSRHCCQEVLCYGLVWLQWIWDWNRKTQFQKYT